MGRAPQPLPQYTSPGPVEQMPSQARSAVAAQLIRFETDKSLQFQIVGHSDSTGGERNNIFLRTGRAKNVFHLFGPSARSRVFAVKPASHYEYLQDNTTAMNRAANRAVVVEIFAGGGGTI